MLKSELARELRIDPSVMSKRCNVYFARAKKPDENVLSAETVEHLRQAAGFIRDQTAKNWPNAVERVLGKYTDPVPTKSVTDIVQRLDRLETSLAKVAEDVEWMATYLRMRAEQQDKPRTTSQATLLLPSVPKRDSPAD